MQTKKGAQLDFNEDYLPNSDPEDYVDRVQLELLPQAERQKYVLQLWRTCYNLAWSVGIILKQHQLITTKIRLFGRQLAAQQNVQTMKLHEKPAWYIIMPDSKFKTIWNVTVILLLVYTSTFVPFQVAFVDTDSDFTVFVNYMVDILFGFDIIINFFSAFVNTSHRVEIRLKNIVMEYLTGWFVLDLLATFPL